VPPLERRVTEKVRAPITSTHPFPLMAQNADSSNNVAIVAIVILVVLAVLAGYFLFFQGGGGTAAPDGPSIELNVPDSQ
jgi:hypothetical protein